jgi:hypothetical protein
VTGLLTWGSGQPGQVGNQAALTVEPVLGSRLVNLILQNHHFAQNTVIPAKAGIYGGKCGFPPSRE